LQNVPDTLDKREGSVIYDALAPACYQLAEYYLNLRKFMDDVFITTATGEYLDYRVLERAITRYPATNAVRKGTFTFTTPSGVVPIGSRFSTIDGDNSVNFTVTGVYVNSEGVAEPGSYLLTCEETGNIGNNYIGSLLAITNINGLTSATLSDVITPARDVETDEELRARYLLTVQQKPFGGNIAQYDEEIKGIQGVGEVQIYPVWNGGGTVKCVVVGADYNTVSDDFVAQIQNKIDPTPQGTGVGIAPIGHTVTIATPTRKTIDISATVTTNKYTLQQLKPSIEAAISDYIMQLRKDWGVAKQDGTYSLGVYISRINHAILSVNDVVNVTNTRINGSDADLTLNQTATLQELPILGTVTLNG
jgi:uncharacterized phage protein gp47/JayE